MNGQVQSHQGDLLATGLCSSHYNGAYCVRLRHVYSRGLDGLARARNMHQGGNSRRDAQHMDRDTNGHLGAFGSQASASR